MKKLLILGGAQAQVQLISSAKEFGYYVVVCDWTNTNPGIALADKHYQVSTLDRDAVLKVAKEENVDGVISNSEPAMPNVNYIANELGLIGNPVQSIETLMSKYKFRDLQDKLGLYSPKHYIVNTEADFKKRIQKLELPFIIKPSESSGSRGTTKVEKIDLDECLNSFNECINFSMDDSCCVEEYVESSIDYVIEGDIFIYKNKFFWNGLFFTYRSKELPMVPQTSSFPLKIEDDELDTVKDAIIKIFTDLNITFGEYNLEMYFNKSNKLFIIEINPRQGGNYLPISVERHCGINYNKLLVSLAAGDETYYQKVINSKSKSNYYTAHIVFNHKAGIYKELSVADEIKEYVVEIKELKNNGEQLEVAKNATDAVAYVFLDFGNYDTQKKYDISLEDYIVPVMEENL